MPFQDFVLRLDICNFGGGVFLKGLTPPCLESELPAAEDDFVCIPGAETCSNHSTPLSNENDLEWDGDLSR